MAKMRRVQFRETPSSEVQEAFVNPDAVSAIVPCGDGRCEVFFGGGWLVVEAGRDEAMKLLGLSEQQPEGGR